MTIRGLAFERVRASAALAIAFFVVSVRIKPGVSSNTALVLKPEPSTWWRGCHLVDFNSDLR